MNTCLHRASARGTARLRSACRALTFALLALACLVAMPGQAATKVWNTTSDGAWENPENWSPNEVPAPTDDVIINNLGTFTVTISSDVTFNTLSVGGSTGVKTLEWSAGAITGGTLTVQAGAVLSLVSLDDRSLTGLVLNKGTIRWEDNGPFAISFKNGAIENDTGGVFDLRTDVVFSGEAGNCWLNNKGTFRKLDGFGITLFPAAFGVTNRGTVEIQAGTLQFNSGFTSSGGFTVGVDGALEIYDGTYHFETGHTISGAGFYGVAGGSPKIDGPITSTAFQFALGTVTFSNLVSGTLNWTGGDLAGSLIIAAGGKLNIQTEGTKNLLGVVTNRGTVVWEGSGPTEIVFVNGRVENETGGLFDMQMDAKLTVFADDGTFHNAGGTFRKSAGSGTATMDTGFEFLNAGTVQVQAGSLDFLDGFTSSGAFAISAGTALHLAGGTFHLSAGNSFSGAGFYGVAQGAVVVDGPISGSNFQLTGGTLSASNLVTGTLQWSGGNFGGTPTVASGATLNISANTTKAFAGVLTNAGRVNLTPTAGNDLNFNSGKVENLNGGLFDLQGDTTLSASGGPGSFNNAGTLRKSGGASFGGLSLPLVNTGLIEAQSGTLTLSQASDLAGGRLNFLISGPTTFGQVLFSGTPTLGGELGTTAAGNFQPAEGTVYRLVNFGARTGTFASTNFYALNVPLGWRVDYNAGDVTVTIVNTSPPTGLKVWTNPQGGLWNTAVNWNPPGVPGPGHDVRIDLDGFYAVNISTGAVFQTLVLGASIGAPSIEWSGGPLTGPMTVGANAKLILTNTAFRTLTGVITNHGFLTWHANGPDGLTLKDARIENMSGALFDMQKNGQFLWEGGTASVQNAGVMRKSSGSGATGFPANIAVTNNGVMDVQQGAFLFSGGFDSSGEIRVATGATVHMITGTFTFHNGHFFSGEGFYGVNSGAPFINGPINEPNFRLNGGTLMVSNQINGTLKWTGGSLAGAPTVAASGRLEIDSAAGKALTATITNRGHIHWLATGSGTVALLDAKIYNLAGADFEMARDGNFSRGNGTPEFHNSGTFRKTGGTATGGFANGIVFKHGGSVEVNSGTLQMPDGYVRNDGTFTLGLAAPLAFGKLLFNGAVTLGGTLNVNALDGYAPALGTSFPIIAHPGATGNFALTNLFALPPGLAWQLGYGATGVTLTVAASTVLQPALGFSVANGLLTLSWAGDTDAGFVLQSTTDLRAPADWQPVAAQVVVVGNLKTVVLPLTGPAKFLRLAKIPPG